MSGPSVSEHRVITEVVERAATRIGVRSAIVSAATSFVSAALVFAVWRLASNGPSRSMLENAAITLVIVGVGAVMGWAQSRVARERAAQTLDARVPSSRNLLVTAHEVLTGTSSARTDADVASLVLARATTIARAVDVNALFPLTRALQWLGGSVALWIATALLLRSAVPSVVATAARTAAANVSGRVAITGLTATITPPRYTHRAETSAREMERVDALRGSSIRFTINAAADSLIAVSRDSAGEHRQSLARSGNAFTLTVNADADRYLAFEPRRADGRAGDKRLIVINVRADESPRVRITAPAKDLVVADANRTLSIALQADDDIALSSLRLKYTKVSGSGERFTFSEGEVPVSLNKGAPSEWSARASLALAPLLTEDGDLVVYRAVATDNRPGAEPVESDAFIAELAAKGGVAALGFSVDPDEDRYALSQQMVILKTERLIAKRSSMTPQAIADESAQLATEQRRVRAEFVFMMGGEFAQEATGEAGEELDESAEAESESDLSAGRMVNRGRSALLNAVRSMSRAATALTTANLDPALVSEKRALVQLQDAFARARFLMKALSQREQLDMTRRQSGKLDSIARAALSVPDGERDAKAAAWRGVLSDVLSASTATNYASLAERVLQIDATSASSQRIASWLMKSSTSAASRDSAALAITTVLRGVTRPAAVAPGTIDARRLRSTLESSRGATPKGRN